MTTPKTTTKPVCYACDRHATGTRTFPELAGTVKPACARHRDDKKDTLTPLVERTRYLANGAVTLAEVLASANHAATRKELKDVVKRALTLTTELTDELVEVSDELTSVRPTRPRRFTEMNRKQAVLLGTELAHVYFAEFGLAVPENDWISAAFEQDSANKRWADGTYAALYEPAFKSALANIVADHKQRARARKAR